MALPSQATRLKKSVLRRTCLLVCSFFADPDKDSLSGAITIIWVPKNQNPDSKRNRFGFGLSNCVLLALDFRIQFGQN